VNQRKKLIEVSIPLEAINAASKKQKAPKGYPTSLHKYWAQRPISACRAILFAQLVDDPSSWPDRFPTEEEQDAERRRLHKVIEGMVPWEASNNESVLNEARWEIARSVAWGLGEDAPSKDRPTAVLDYLQTKAPPVYDPFSGAGSIPLEAQRLGLRAYGSDLNPVAVLIGKALVEIPPRFARQPPVNPKAREEAKHGDLRGWRGSQGLAEDVRYYGQWIRSEAEKRVGHLYPKASLPDGSQATVIAWLWARTVRSPDPIAKGAMVPLVSSFMLSTKEGSKAWAKLVIDDGAQDGWRFEVKSGALSKADEKAHSNGTKRGRAMFHCILTGANISGAYIDDEAQAGRMSARLMAIVAEGNRSRVYLAPSADHERIAAAAALHISEHGDEMNLPRQECRGTFASNAQGRRYCFKTFADYFTARQLVTLSTFSDLVSEVREKVVEDGCSCGLSKDGIPIRDGGTGANAYGDAVSTYLAFAVSRAADYGSSISTWLTDDNAIRGTFGRQAIPMTWDFCEGGYFGDSSAALSTILNTISEVIAHQRSETPAFISNIDATKNGYPVRPSVMNTDPPYYNNMAYADLADFFYVWLRRSLSSTWPDIFRRLTTPKDEELIATPYRHGGKENAEDFFMRGMSEALTAMGQATDDDYPLVIYYAFKQSEETIDGVTSAGWSTFLQAVVASGLVVDGTWPLRTESAGRLIGRGANALASSIVLVCRKLSTNAGIITRSDFIRLLKRELPAAIDDIRKAGVGPVDMQQSVIGPGMGIFSRHSKVLDDDDSAMSVKTALSLINRVWGEMENELDAAFDAETQVALAWYADYGFDARASGDLITLANAKNISSDALFVSEVFSNLKGKAALTTREDLPKDWSPATDTSPTVWECVQHTARVLNAEDGGGEAAALLVGQMGAKAAAARTLAYRLFEIATQKGWNQEALVYNELAQEWPHLEELASTARREATPAQASFI